MLCKSLLRLTAPVLILWAQTVSLVGESQVKIWEADVVLPSYRLEAADKNAMFYKNESYQGAQKRIYPYPLMDHVTGIREEKSFRFVFLENDYIKLSLLPEIGGRLFSALDKTNGYEIFYHQHVIKPALIGMLGAWISGGIEWCVFHHHRNTTHMPVDYALAENADGSKTIWIGETERRHRMKWLIGITLYPDRSYIEATVKLFNRTALPHSILYWANVAVHVNDEYQVVFPPSVQYATYHSKNDFVHWPVGAESYRGVDYRDVDLSWWKNHPEPISFFAWDLEEDFMGGYDHGRRAGVVHVGNHHVVAGAKLWEWSPGPRGRMWDKILTDADGPYAELMVGAYSDNQPDYSWIKPDEVKTFKQYWYPIREIGGFKKANLEAAVNLGLEKGKAKFGFNTTSEWKEAKAVLEAEGKPVFVSRLDIGPGSPFVQEVEVGDSVHAIDLEVSLYDASGRLLISYRPRERQYDPDLPPVVKPPAPPESIETVEELYLTGLRVQQIHSPGVDPEAYFREALRRDPGDTRTNTIVGINLYRRGLYAEAERHLRTAIARLSAEYTRPSTTESEYHLGLALRAQNRQDEAYEHFYRASWDYAFRAAALHQLAEISCLRGHFDTALEEIDRSLSTNALNTRGRAVRAAVLRQLGRPLEARQAALQALEQDPLDFLARNEWALASPASEQEGRMQQLRKMMRDEVQSYLELASDYGRLGLWREAVDVLRRPVEFQMDFAGSYPMIYYFLGYYSLKSGDQPSATEYFRLAPQMPADYCFPYRLESIDVLEAAIDSNPADARAYFYLGNLLYEIQPRRAIEAWEKSRQLDPAFASTHRNLGWAYHRHEGDISKSISSYERAVAADSREPRLFTELDQLYELANVDPEKRLALLEGNHATVVTTNHSFYREIAVQVLVGHYEKAIDSLSNNYFHVREGGGEIHDVFVDAHLLRGLRYVEEGRYREAEEDFLRAADYPENLSVGVPRRDPRAAQVAFYTGMNYEALGEAGKARSYYEKAARRQDSRTWPEASFYQALALAKLEKGEEAAQIFDGLIADGARRLKETAGTDFFAKFGERQTPEAQKAFAHYVAGLGYLGKGMHREAREAFEKSVSLNASSVWAKYRLEYLR